MTGLIVVLALILLNGVFAMAEISVVSANRHRLRQRAENGDAGAQRALDLADNPTDFLSTVQIGITLIGVFAGAYGGATLAQPVAQALGRISWLAGIADSVALALVVGGITYVSLVIGELVPKRLGLNAPETAAARIAGPMHALSVLGSPIVAFLSASTNAVLWLLRVKPSGEPDVSEAEIEGMVEQGRQAGVVEPAEQEIIENAFWLGERRTASITTPRTSVAWLDANDDEDEILATIRRDPLTRYLVCEGEVDRFLGFVHTRALLVASLEKGTLDLRAMVQRPLVVPETLPVLALLERFKAEGIHFAVVLDEYGGVTGIATLSDILEELVGEVARADDEQRELEELPGGGWTVDGMLDVGEAVERMGVAREAEVADEDYNSVGGFVAARLERIPALGDTFLWRGHRFTVTRMDGMRVDRIQVTTES